nr:hypothetical protein [Candidatus Freyarchaeota archaeon]
MRWEVGLPDSVVYNSITFHVSDREIAEFKNIGVKSGVPLGYNPRNVKP